MSRFSVSRLLRDARDAVVVVATAAAFFVGGSSPDQAAKQVPRDTVTTCCPAAPVGCATVPTGDSKPKPLAQSTSASSTGKVEPASAARPNVAQQCATTPCIPSAGQILAVCGTPKMDEPSLLDRVKAVVQEIVGLSTADHLGFGDLAKALQQFLDIAEHILKLYADLGALSSLAIVLLAAYFTRRSWGRLLFHAWLYRAERKPVGDKPFLLDGQKKAIDTIDGMVSKLNERCPGVLLGLKGQWGDGKSYVLFAAKETLEEGSNDVAVVSLNIWEHQRELDLHFALVKAVLSHPRVLARCIDAYPVQLLFVPLLMALIRMLPKGWSFNFEVSRLALKASVPVSIPLPWQGGFRRVVDEAACRRLKLVVILDEIDRAEPEVAQAAMTMTRRALDLPGVMTILPYVEAQIRHKVFNPLTAVSPDLRATMFAVIDETYPGRNGMSIEPKDSQTQIENKYRNALLGLWLKPYGAEDFDSVEAARYRLFRNFSEKYLNNKIVLHRLTPTDLEPLASHSAVTSNIWDKARDGVSTTALRDAASASIGGTKHLARVGAPSIRAFEGEMLRLLSEFNSRPDSVPPSSGAEDAAVAAQLLALIGVAYLLAGSRQSSTR